MYGDQALALRELVKRTSTHPPVRRAQYVVVVGGNAGVGSTSVACGLAATQADQGIRTLLVDAAMNAGASESLGRASQFALPDVVRDLGKAVAAIQPGPSGAYLLPNHPIPLDLPATELREISETVSAVIAQLATGFDAVIVDCGNQTTPLWRLLWGEADHVLVICSTTDESVMGAYAAIKSNAQAESQDIRVLVNGAETRTIAEGIWRRINTAAQRFLNRSPGFAGYVPYVTEGSSDDALLPALQNHATGRLCLRRIISDLDDSTNASDEANAARAQLPQPAKSAE